MSLSTRDKVGTPPAPPASPASPASHNSPSSSPSPKSTATILGALGDLKVGSKQDTSQHLQDMKAQFEDIIKSKTKLLEAWRATKTDIEAATGVIPQEDPKPKINFGKMILDAILGVVEPTTLHLDHIRKNTDKALEKERMQLIMQCAALKEIDTEGSSKQEERINIWLTICKESIRLEEAYMDMLQQIIDKIAVSKKTESALVKILFFVGTIALKATTGISLPDIGITDTIDNIYAKFLDAMVKSREVDIADNVVPAQESTIQYARKTIDDSLKIYLPKLKEAAATTETKNEEVDVYPVYTACTFGLKG